MHTTSPVYSLSIHADYGCRHSGACCTAGWRIPIENSGEHRLTEAAARGVLPRVDLERRGRLTVLPLAATGNCVFYRESSINPAEAGSHGSGGVRSVNPAASGTTASPFDLPSAGFTTPPSLCDPSSAGFGTIPSSWDPASAGFHENTGTDDGRCAVHRALGHDALPLACRQFPRVSLIDPRGTFVALSHFCPTAAGQLFRDDVPLAIVHAPVAFPAGAEYDGLDARDALPPLLRPGMLMDYDGFAEWEAFAVGCFADSATAEHALTRVAMMTERLRGWRPSDGRLIDCVREAATACGTAPAQVADAAPDPAHRSLVNACLPAGFARRVLPHDFTGIDGRMIAPHWSTFVRPIRTYLAARLFGSWLAYQGRGLRTLVRALQVARSVLRLECVRACGEAGRPLDRELLTRAVRETDRLLVHEMSSLAFARRLSAREAQPLVAPRRVG